MSDEKRTPDTQEIVMIRGEGDEKVINKVEIKRSLSAKDYLHLKNYIGKQMTMKTEPDGFDDKGSPKFKSTPTIKGSAMAELETETMRAYVVTFNEDANNPYNRMMEKLDGREYEKVWDAVNEANTITEKK